MSTACNAPSTARDGKLIFEGRPAHERRGAVDAQKDEGGLPDGRARLGIGGLRPDVGVPVLGRGYDLVRVGRPVDRGDDCVVL